MEHQTCNDAQETGGIPTAFLNFCKKGGEWLASYTNHFVPMENAPSPPQ